MFHVPNRKEGDPLWTKEGSSPTPVRGSREKRHLLPTTFGQTDWEIRWKRRHIRFRPQPRAFRIFSTLTTSPHGRQAKRAAGEHFGKQIQ